MSAPLIRLAWREAVRAKARSALVVVLIALPVLGVTVASVLLSTTRVSGPESLDRRLGSADALVTATGAGRAFQLPDPDAGYASEGSGRQSEADVRRLLALPSDAPVVPVTRGSGQLRLGDALLPVDVVGADLAAPITDGLFRLRDGRWPAGDDEVVVNSALAERGVAVGDSVDLGGPSRRVVGIADSAQERTAYVVAGRFDDVGQAGWLVGGGPVDWSEVQALNAVGFTVLSRQVVLDPPPASSFPPQVRDSLESRWQDYLAVVVLVVVMALIEVVLLAGPAFAVQARRQSRSLALMAAAGATPRHLRRAVLAYGLVLGGLGVVTGLALGVVSARLLVPVAQRFSDTWIGPFQVVWWQLAAIAAFGLVSALLAAVVPAWIASRQDVVAVLAGRRGDAAPSYKSPVLGVLLLAVGVAAAAWGATTRGFVGVYAIAGAAIVAVLGMVLLVGTATVLVSRLVGRFPVPVRFAARDAARHRTRTVPAVAAVAATVAGVVALGIANESDNAASAATYEPQLSRSWGVVLLPGAQDPDAALRLLDQAGIEAQPVLALSDYTDTSWREVRLRWPGSRSVMRSSSGALGTQDVVADALPEALPLSAAERARGNAALAAGDVVVFVDEDVSHSTGRIRLATSSSRSPWTEVPLTFLQGQRFDALSTVIPTRVAAGLGEPRVALYAFRSSLDHAAEQRLTERLAGLGAHVYVEHGFQREQSTVIIFWILGAVGALLMLGGTLTATFLALSDARPDLATLSAVGAVPRTRRAIAGAYALVVGLLGALLGVVVGMIPGVAVTYPLTSNRWAPGDASTAAFPDHVLAVPWGMIGGLVVALPLLTALVVGLTARSRLPLVARLD